MLGILTEGQDALEERLMKDDEAFELLRAEEEELIQEYADGELSDMEREKFESHFLISDERLKKVEFATALKTRIDGELSQLS